MRYSAQKFSTYLIAISLQKNKKGNQREAEYHFYQTITGMADNPSRKIIKKFLFILNIIKFIKIFASQFASIQNRLTARHQLIVFIIIHQISSAIDEMFIKFFELNFDVGRLAANLKRPTKQLQQKMKEEIKSLLIDLEGDLLRSKRINSIIFLNLVNPEVDKKLINIDKILDKKSTDHFLNYYRSRLVQFNINMPHHLETVYPISVDSRVNIYRQFVQYVKNEHLIDEQQRQNPLTTFDIIKRGFAEDRQQVYDQRELDFIYVIYDKNKGNINEMFTEIQTRGLYDKKYEKTILEFKIANLKLLGLYKVYTMTATWMDGNLLRWNKFIKCYGNVFHNWAEEDQKKLLKIAVNNQASVEQIKHITFKMGMASAKQQSCVLEMIDNDQGHSSIFQRRQPMQNYELCAPSPPRFYQSDYYQELSSDNYYEPVRKFNQNEEYQEYERSNENTDTEGSESSFQYSPQPYDQLQDAGQSISNSIKEQIRKKIARNSRNL